jgi:hypothetical protein
MTGIAILADVDVVNPSPVFDIQGSTYNLKNTTFVLVYQPLFK